MKQKTKRLLILLAVLAAVTAATFGFSKYEQKQEAIKASEQVLLQIPFRSVQSFSWEYADDEGGLCFTQEDSVWSYASDEAFPVSESKLMNIIGHFSSFCTSFTIENVDDYSQYGLSDPNCTISIEAESGSYTIKLGDYSQMDSMRYIDIGDGNVYLATEDPSTWLDYALSDLILHDDTPGFEDVVDVTFTGNEDYTLVYKKDSSSYSEEDVYFTEDQPLDTASVQQLLNTVTALELLDFVTYNATDEELAACGLADPELTITVRYLDGDNTESCTVHIGSAATEDSDSQSPDRYVRIGDSSIIYHLDSVDYAILTAVSYDDLRHKELFWGDLSDVTQIDVTLEGTTHTLAYDQEKADAEETDYDWFYGDDSVDISAVQSALEAIQADTFTQSETPGQLEISLQLHLNNENFPLVEISLYRYSGDLCLARVDGTTVALVPRSEVMDLVESVQAIVL